MEFQLTLSDVKLEYNFKLPSNIDKLIVMKSLIDYNLTIRKNITLVRFINTCVSSSKNVRIDDQIRNIELINICGSIIVSHFLTNESMKMIDPWSFELYKQENGVINKFSVINAIFIDNIIFTDKYYAINIINSIISNDLIINMYDEAEEVIIKKKYERYVFHILL